MKKPEKSRLKASFAAAIIGFFGVATLEVLPENPKTDATFSVTHQNGSRMDYNLTPSDQFWKTTLTLDRQSLDQQIQKAAKDGDSWRMRILIDKGADVNAGHGAMIVNASKGGHSDVLNLLFDNGVTIGNDTVLREALLGAMIDEHFETAELLSLRGGVDTKVFNAEVLSVAAYMGDVNMMDILLMLGVDPSASGYKSLFNAIDSGNAEAVMMILSYAPPPEVREKALKRALETEQPGIASLIRETTPGTKPSIPTGPNP